MKAATLIVVAFLLAATSCSRRMPVTPSPDGSMVLVTSVEHSRADPGAYRCLIFEIRDRSGTTLHRENTRASVTMRWSIEWLSNDRVRLESSDIGTYYWKRQPDEGWKKE